MVRCAVLLCENCVCVTVAHCSRRPASLPSCWVGTTSHLAPPPPSPAVPLSPLVPLFHALSGFTQVDLTCLKIALMTDTLEGLARIQDVRYRMVTEGVQAIPLQPHWCALRPGMCMSKPVKGWFGV